MSAWNCMSSSLTTMPPSVRNSFTAMPVSFVMASRTSRVWNAVDSSAARAMWPLLA
jgi:hypothetical protein